MALIFPHWLLICKRFFITIKDIKDMKKGQMSRLFFFDENIKERINNAKKKTNTKHKVSIEALIDTAYTAVFEKDSDLCGSFLWKYTTKRKRNRIYRKETVLREDKARWFDVEYDKGCWQQLNENGVLELDEDNEKFTHLHGKRWDELPEDLLVGWSGPCLKIQDLQRLPNAFSY
jgi:hypothetical protein